MKEYPDNNPKTQFGLAKCPVHLVPPALIRGAAEAWKNGADKYGPFNWREKMISATVYYAAAIRHLTDWYDRVDADDCAPDSGVHHVKHAVACLGMILDVMESPMFNDNRPPGVKRCQAAITSSTKKLTKNNRLSSKSGKSATKRAPSSKRRVGSTKATALMSTTPTPSPRADQTDPRIGAFGRATLTAQKAISTQNVAPYRPYRTALERERGIS